jgi:hypothetical protein
MIAAILDLRVHAAPLSRLSICAATLAGDGAGRCQIVVYVVVSLLLETGLLSVIFLCPEPDFSPV